MCKFSVATSSGKGETEWHRIVAFGRSAEIAMEYLSKGRQVIVQGNLRYGQWTDRDGNQRKYAEVRANRLELVGGAGDNGNGARAPEPRPSSAVPEQAGTVDMPF